jgi:deoxycytidylate deaminase
LVHIGQDRPSSIKHDALVEILDVLRRSKLLNEMTLKSSSHDLAKSISAKLKGTQFANIGEFGRPVHGEMAALLDAARRGIAVSNLTMFVTTFPCHNCAKHIVASGIAEVIYIEPYAKSRAAYLFKEEIETEDSKALTVNPVRFRRYTGIAPSQYHDLFSMTHRGAKKGVALTEWKAARNSLLPILRAQNPPSMYLHNEATETEVSCHLFKRKATVGETK